MGIAMEEKSEEEDEAAKEAELRADLDADYFQWKEEQEEAGESIKDKVDRFSSVLKSITSGKK